MRLSGAGRLENAVCKVQPGMQRLLEVEGEVMDDLISRQAAIDAVYKCTDIFIGNMPIMVDKADAYEALAHLPSAQPEDYAELKREFIRMASYVDVLLECSDEQKETLIGFISRLAEFMPWTERD
jgi:hypothetical protein